MDWRSEKLSRTSTAALQKDLRETLEYLRRAPARKHGETDVGIARAMKHADDLEKKLRSRHVALEGE
jgi:hypothetical protein